MGVLFERLREGWSGLRDESWRGDLGLPHLASPSTEPGFKLEGKALLESSYRHLPSFLKSFAKPFVTPEVYQNRLRHISPLQADALSRSITALEHDTRSEKPLAHRSQQVWGREGWLFYSIHFYLPENILTEAQQNSLFSLAAGLNKYADFPMQYVYWDADAINIGSEQHPFYGAHYNPLERDIHLEPLAASAEVDYFFSIQSIYVHEFMHYLFRGREIFKDADWTEIIYPLCLGNRNYEILQDANYVEGTPNHRSGHPWDNANEAFASGGRAFYFSADQFATFILHPETPPEMAKFGKLVWCYMRDRVFGGVFTQDGRDPFARESLDDLLAQAKDRRLYSLLQGIQDPVSHEMASYHLLEGGLVSFREIPRLFHGGSSEEKKDVLRGLILAVQFGQEQHLAIRNSMFPNQTSISSGYTIPTSLECIIKTAIAMALQDADPGVRWWGLRGLESLHQDPVKTFHAILPLVKGENQELAHQARDFLEELFLQKWSSISSSASLNEISGVFDALVDLAHHGTVDNSTWAFFLLKNNSRLWDLDSLTETMMEFAETHPELEVRRHAFSYLRSKFLEGSPEQISEEEEIKEIKSLSWRIWAGETDASFRVLVIQNIYELEKETSFSDTLEFLKLGLSDSNSEVFFASAGLLREVHYLQPSIETSILVELMMSRLWEIAEKHPQIEERDRALNLIIENSEPSELNVLFWKIWEEESDPARRCMALRGIYYLESSPYAIDDFGNALSDNFSERFLDVLNRGASDLNNERIASESASLLADVVAWNA